MVYEWHKGETFKGIDPTAAGEVVSRIAEQNGGAAPTPDIVDAARPESSPIHEAFTWDDEHAAENWRRTEARRLVENLVVIEETDDGPVRRPAFYSISYERRTNGHTEHARGYTPVDVVRTDVVARDSAAEHLLRQLAGLEERFSHLGDEFTPIWRAVARVRDKIGAG